jgi:hypothetical protein
MEWLLIMNRIGEGEYAISSIFNNGRVFASEKQILTERCGSYGWFQKVASVLLIMAIMAGDLQVYNMAFFQLTPSYQCNIDGAWSPCSPSDWCGDHEGMKHAIHKVDWLCPRSLSNWVSQLNLPC